MGEGPGRGCGVGVSRCEGTWGVVQSPSPLLPADPGLHGRGAVGHPPVPPGSRNWSVEGEIWDFNPLEGALALGMFQFPCLCPFAELHWRG